MDFTMASLTHVRYRTVARPLQYSTTVPRRKIEWLPWARRLPSTYSTYRYRVDYVVYQYRTGMGWSGKTTRTVLRW